MQSFLSYGQDWGSSFYLREIYLTSFGRVKLHVPHVSVLTAFGEQLIVGALLIDYTVLQHNDLVRILDGAKTMGNHEDCPFATKSI